MKTATIEVTLSSQAIELLESLAQRGVWGTDRSEVAARLINEALAERFIEPMTFGVRIRRGHDGGSV